MWTRKQFEDAAQKVGNDYTAANGTVSINDLSLKVAQDNGLNTEGIRTVVRLANIAVFENMFGKSAEDKAEDRMFDFPVGDPEQVIALLGNMAKTASDTSAPVAYDRTLDFYGDLDAKPFEKCASSVVHMGIERSAERPIPAAELRLTFSKAAERMSLQQKEAEILWYDHLEKAAQMLRVDVVSSVGQEAFEKSAVAICGDTVVPELKLLRRMNGLKDEGPLLGDQVKIAQAQEYIVSTLPKKIDTILGVVKEANAARKRVNEVARGLAWVVKTRETL